MKQNSNQRLFLHVLWCGYVMGGSVTRPGDLLCHYRNSGPNSLCRVVDAAVCNFRQTRKRKCPCMECFLRRSMHLPALFHIALEPSLHNTRNISFTLPRELPADHFCSLKLCFKKSICFNDCRALQIPPEAWLRMSLYHGSMTWITIRPSGRVGLKCLGDAGFMPAGKLTTS